MIDTDLMELYPEDPYLEQRIFFTLEPSNRAAFEELDNIISIIRSDGDAFKEQRSRYRLRSQQKKSLRDLLTEGAPISHNVSSPPLDRDLVGVSVSSEAATSGDESDSDLDTKIWHGCIVFSLDDYPAGPGIGWRLGRGPFEIEAEEPVSRRPEVYLSAGPRSGSFRLHHRAAAINFTETMGLVGIRRMNQAIGTLEASKIGVISDKTKFHPLWPADILSIGHLSYRCRYAPPTASASTQEDFKKAREAFMKESGRTDPLSPAASTPSESDWAVGDWRLFKKIGAGSSGDVIAAVNESSGDAGAVKKFKRQKELDDARDVLQKVKACVADQEYRNNVQVFQDYVEHPNGDLRYLINTPLALGDLGYFMRAWKTAPAQDVSYRAIALQILRGVAALHGANIVHRDIKPANIGVVSISNLHIILIDLDGAKCLSGLQDGIPAVLEGGGGTVGYIAPEREISDICRSANKDGDDIQTYGLSSDICRSANKGEDDIQEYGLPSDIWSIGCVLLNLFYDQRLECKFNPWRHRDYLVKVKGLSLRAVIHERQRFARLIERLNDDVEDPISNLISSMLKMKAQLRPTAAEALTHRSLAQQISLEQEAMLRIGSKRRISFVEYATGTANQTLPYVPTLTEKVPSNPEMRPGL